MRRRTNCCAEKKKTKFTSEFGHGGGTHNGHNEMRVHIRVHEDAHQLIEADHGVRIHRHLCSPCKRGEADRLMKEKRETINPKPCNLAPGAFD